jgi:hypothetical protein
MHSTRETEDWDLGYNWRAERIRNGVNRQIGSGSISAAIVNLVKLQRYVQNVYPIHSAGERATTSERSSGWLVSQLVSRSDREFVHSHAIHSAGFFMDRTQLLGSLSVLNASGTTVPVNVSPWSPPTSEDHSPV